MRPRTSATLVFMLVLGVGLLSATQAQAMIPVSPSADLQTASDIGTAGVSPSTSPAQPCTTGAHGSVTTSLPKLSAPLDAALQRYARNLPASASVSRWYDTGGAFGGGVPARAVRDLMRRGLANGLTQSQAESFLTPSFLRGMNDPQGGPWLFRFIAWQNDPNLYGQLASYAQGLAGPELSPLSAQAGVFETFPMLQAAYMAQALAVPPDLASASQVLALANAGYAPAQRSVQAILASGNHPSAGAQNAGGVGTGVRSFVYDYFVQSYVGPLSSAARTALVNRKAYGAWVERIAAWEASGGLMKDVPQPATFSTSLPGSLSSGSATETLCPAR